MKKEDINGYQLIVEKIRMIIHNENTGINTNAFSNYGHLKYDASLKDRKSALRQDRNLAEIFLWKKLKKNALGVNFNRQKGVGFYIIDFFCSELLLAIVFPIPLLL